MFDKWGRRGFAWRRCTITITGDLGLHLLCTVICLYCDFTLCYTCILKNMFTSVQKKLFCGSLHCERLHFNMYDCHMIVTWPSILMWCFFAQCLYPIALHSKEENLCVVSIVSQRLEFKLNWTSYIFYVDLL